MNYVIGIDQGASKTHALVVDELGNIRGFGKSYGACHSSSSVDYAIQAVKEAVYQAIQESGIDFSEVSVLAAGMTGLDWDHEIEILTQELQKALPIKNVLAVNDCIIAMRAGTSKKQGCVLCAGSGLNCAVRKSNNEQIIYGFYIDDDLQGGVSLGKRTVRAVLESHIGIKPETLLTKLVLSYFKVHTVDELLYIKTNGKISFEDYLHLPKILEEAASLNDKVALDELSQYGTSIAQYVICGMKKLNMLDADVDVVLSGSIFKCKPSVLKEAVAHEIHRYAINAKIVDAAYEPAVGAALMGLDTLFDELAPEVYARLEKTAGEFKMKRIKGE